MRTKRAHSPSFDTFPKVGKGERVTFLRLDEKNPGWFLGEDGKGVEGYFPVGAFSFVEDGYVTALEDYDARELELPAGEAIEVLTECGGWLRVESKIGIGWIPKSCLS
ncbi:MAG: hypothetical protein AB3N64_04855 [Puniceicoccaceae bacterium]